MKTIGDLITESFLMHDKELSHRQRTCEPLYEGNDLDCKCADMILVDNENRILLLKRPETDNLFPGKWCLPGGHRQDDESIRQGAERECQEESNINIDGQSTKIMNWTFPDGFKTTFFWAKQGKDWYDQQEVKLSDEHTEFKWCKKEDALKMDLAGDLVEPLIKCFETIEI